MASTASTTTASSSSSRKTTILTAPDVLKKKYRLRLTEDEVDKLYTLASILKKDNTMNLSELSELGDISCAERLKKVKRHCSYFFEWGKARMSKEKEEEDGTMRLVRPFMAYSKTKTSLFNTETTKITKITNSVGYEFTDFYQCQDPQQEAGSEPRSPSGDTLSFSVALYIPGWLFKQEGAQYGQSRYYTLTGVQRRTPQAVPFFNWVVGKLPEVTNSDDLLEYCEMLIVSIKEENCKKCILLHPFTNSCHFIFVVHTA